ncbi:hypothetical protein LTR09_008444 [Extremus antarcticus]|uniref:Uncharacterized protein n=1 Tax=Extremus antarcticus TaxID=702011 RepID=A0AAJ0DAQ4_9PEZI|nr:hypothetical protein LTR09_008444 [Extremus antarcticus]
MQPFETIDNKADGHPGIGDPPLLRVSRRVRGDALPVYYHHTPFRFGDVHEQYILYDATRFVDSIGWKMDLVQDMRFKLSSNYPGVEVWFRVRGDLCWGTAIVHGKKQEKRATTVFERLVKLVNSYRGFRDEIKPAAGMKILWRSEKSFSVDKREELGWDVECGGSALRMGWDMTEYEN